MKNAMKAIVFSVLFLFAVSQAFAEDTASTSQEKFMTIKVFGGYNMWILGSAVIPSTNISPGNSFSTGGFSFGGDVLFFNPKGIQLGISAAYLPLMLLTVGGSTLASMSMIPLTADVVFNTGIFYTDLGLGIAFMGANLSGSSSLGGFFTNVTAPSPGFIVKAGIGFNIKIIDFLGLDVGGALYLPISDFGLSNGEINPFLGIILFSQFNLRAGVSFYL